MSELRPIPLSLLIRQAAKSYDRDRTAFGVHRRSMFRGVPGCDMRVRFAGNEIAAPLGVAAGPHTQLAPNIAAGWLAGARLFELKTLRSEPAVIERPTTFPGEAMRHREWSHELAPDEAFVEYAKGAYLIEALRALFIPGNLGIGLERCSFDLSIFPEHRPLTLAQGTPVSVLALDPGRVFDTLREGLRAELPRDLVFLAEIPLPDRLAESVTFSLDHGARFEDLARATDEWRDAGFAVRWKVPPAVLSDRELTELLGDLGYEDWNLAHDGAGGAPEREARAWAERLADEREKGTGIVIGLGPRIERPGEPAGYLSGRSLFPISLAIVERIQSFGYEVSRIGFSGGVDERNYSEIVRAGFASVTLCSDLFRPGGYSRLGRLHRALGREMRAEGAASIAAFREGTHDARGSVERLARSARADDRYRHRTPRRRDITSRLALFDCVNCDLCMPVCPNGANFAYRVEPEKTDRGRFRFESGSWNEIETRTLTIGAGKRPERQIASEAELCNDCGLCEAVCPEEGAPQFVKPRLFLSADAFRRDARDGFLVARIDGDPGLVARRDGVEYELRVRRGANRFRIGRVTCFVDREGRPFRDDGDREAGGERGDCREGDEIDLAIYQRMLWILEALLARTETALAAVHLEEEVW